MKKLFTGYNSTEKFQILILTENNDEAKKLAKEYAEDSNLIGDWEIKEISFKDFDLICVDCDYIIQNNDEDIIYVDETEKICRAIFAKEIMGALKVFARTYGAEKFYGGKHLNTVLSYCITDILRQKEITEYLYRPNILSYYVIQSVFASIPVSDNDSEDSENLLDTSKNSSINLL